MKGQQQAVTAVLISGILIGIVGSVYFWGVPLIQKTRDATTLENSEAFIFLLDQKVKYVAANGGRQSVQIYEPGIVSFDGSSIKYQISTDGTIYASDASIPLGKTKNCDATVQGDFLTDDSAVICVTSTQAGASRYDNTYSLAYRNLGSGIKVYAVQLTGAPSQGSTEHTIIIQNNGVSQSSSGGKQVSTVQIGVSIE